MITWVSLALLAVITVLIIAGLGLPIALVLRLRGFVTLVVAVPAAFAVLSVASILAGAFGIRWSIVAPLALSLILSLALFLLRRWIGTTRRSVTSRVHSLWPGLCAAAIGGAAIAFVLILAMKRGDAVSQTYDAIFHLNAVRYVLDSANASPFAMDMANPGSPTFYPTLWHGLVAIVTQMTGASIPLATNAVLFTVAAVVWPIGVVALGRAIAGPSMRVTVISGVLAAAFPNFPLALAGYGVLYPNLLSIALLPFVLVGALQLLALGPARRADPLTAGAQWLLLLGSVGASTLAHPNAIHVLALWLAVPVICVAMRAYAGRPFMNRLGIVAPTTSPRVLRVILASVGLIAFVGIIAAAWVVGRTGDNFWSGMHGPRAALLDAAGMTPHLAGHAWPLTLFVVLGVLVALSRPALRWTLGAATLLLAFYYIADGFPPAEWRTFFLAPWYSDPWRLAALVPLGAFPLAVLGVSAFASVGSIGVRRLARTAHHQRRRITTFAAGFATVLLLATTQGAAAGTVSSHIESSYNYSDTSRLLSPDEMTLIERLPELVPDDAVIAVNPWNGGALAYAITGLTVLSPHAGGNFGPRVAQITGGISKGTEAACAAARELDAHYVLDFGEQYVFKDTDRAKPFDDISGITDSSVLTEIDREGDAVLYRINCS